LVQADYLFILSDIDGLYSENPAENPSAELIREVTAITPEIEALAGGAGSQFGTGGMATKIAAAKIATAAGIHTVIMNGKNADRIQFVLSGEREGTLFVASADAANSIQRITNAVT